MVLLNMSKPEDKAQNLREFFYKILPTSIVLYVGGGCRPVVMEKRVRETGFASVRRTFVEKPTPSEIVVGFRPGGE